MNGFYCFQKIWHTTLEIMEIVNRNSMAAIGRVRIALPNLKKNLETVCLYESAVVYKTEYDAKSRGRTGSRIINHNQNIKDTIHKV